MKIQNNKKVLKVLVFSSNSSEVKSVRKLGVNGEIFSVFGWPAPPGGGRGAFAQTCGALRRSKTFAAARSSANLDRAKMGRGSTFARLRVSVDCLKKAR